MRQLTDAQRAVLQHVHHYPGTLCLDYNERTVRSLVRADLLRECSVGGYELTRRARERIQQGLAGLPGAS